MDAPDLLDGLNGEVAAMTTSELRWGVFESMELGRSVAKLFFLKDGKRLCLELWGDDKGIGVTMPREVA